MSQSLTLRSFSSIALRVACLLSTSVFCLMACAANPELVPADERVDGKTQDEWSISWWQWAASFEYEDSPVADRVGTKCTARQVGDVWFLAGTYGTKRTVRTCTVPAGKYLFFPLINYVVMPGAGSPPDCASLMRTAARITEDVSALVLDVNDVRFDGLARRRQAPRHCFDIAARSSPYEKPIPAAANGYYVMLRPLEPGSYTINFGGALPSMLQAVTYTLRVE